MIIDNIDCIQDTPILDLSNAELIVIDDKRKDGGYVASELMESQNSISIDQLSASFLPGLTIKFFNDLYTHPSAKS